MTFENFLNWPASVYVSALVALSVAALTVITGQWHGRFSMDGLVGVQKQHTQPAPRIGGVAIFSGLLAAYMFIEPDRATLLGVLLVAGLPAFLSGLIEDLTKQVGVMVRLLATIASGVLACWLTGMSLTSVDLPFLEEVLGITWVSVVFTAFAVGGVANAVNIVDGLNGLASGFVFVVLFGMATIAAAVGDVDLAMTCLIAAAAVMGFWLFNWPYGRLFLGDGGSYFCGFLVAWLGVMLVERNDDVTPFVPLLLCVHPVTEVLFSVYRRRKKSASPGQPDRWHLHTLLMRRVIRGRVMRAWPLKPETAKLISNSMAGLVLALASVPPVLVAHWLMHSPWAAALACLGFALGYVTLYARLVRFGWCSPFVLFFRRDNPASLAD